jgi:diguanylate cyclase
MAETRRQPPWLVRINYRMRTVSFAMAFAAICLHIASKDTTPVTWLLLGLLFLAYPHVQYWRVCRAANPLRSEMRNLLVDSVLLGAAVAALGFPLWIAFSVIIGTLTNNAINSGWRGVAENSLALVAGTLAWAGIMGFNFSPQTDVATTAFCVVSLGWYLLAISNLGFTRNRQLRLTRETLRHRENELVTANQALQRNLREIEGLERNLRETDLVHSQLSDQANRDPLTHLYNRRYLDSSLLQAMARCQRARQPLALILVDIDRFKKINDTHGHQAGDQVLISLGEQLAGMARADDVACRYGGEEFILVLPGMSLDTACDRAEELRASFACKLVAYGDVSLQATLSIGIAVYPEHGASADALIRSADIALYQAKDAGRNSIGVLATALDPA